MADSLTPSGELPLPAHAHTWQPDIIGVMAFADLLTALSYFVIPVALGLFIYRQKELKFKAILLMFILFILACGLSHLLHFTNVWTPAPLLTAGTMLFMMVVSTITAAVIWPVLRKVERFLQERSELQAELALRNHELEATLTLANDRKLALEQREKAFRLIFASAPIGMAVVEPNGRFSMVNRALCDMLGYQAHELEKLTFQEITHPDDLNSDLLQSSRLLEGRAENYRMVKRYIHRNGNIVYAQLDVSLIRSESGDPKYFVSQIQDITESKLTEEALRESQHRFRTLLENLPTAVVVHRPDSSIDYANPAAASLLGLSEDQLLGKTAVDPYWRFLSESGTDMPLHDYPVMKVMDSKRPLKNYLTGVITGKDEPVRWMLVNAFPLKSPTGYLDRIIVSFIDITQRKALQQTLEEQAQTDPLTGLFNRRYLREVANREIARACRTKTPLALMTLDLDHFKQINDTYGHAAGDKVLLKLCSVIKQVTRENDIPCRIGGEEFVVIMPDTDAEQAARVAERLRLQVMDSDITLEGKPSLHWTTSIGIAGLSDDDASIDNVLERADAALYQAKSDGRNRVVVSV